MNDLDLLRTMRSDTPPPSQDALGRARSRLLDRAASRVRWLPPRLRAGWQTAAAATIVIVLGVGAIVSTYERAGGPADHGNGSPSQSPSDTVQSVLARAAQVVAQEPPAPQATDGQYWYVKEVVRATRSDIGADEDELTAEYWYEVGSGRPGKLGRLHYEYETGFVKDVVFHGGEAVVTENGQVVDHPTQPVDAFRDDPADPASRWLPDDAAATAPTNAADMLHFVRDQLGLPISIPHLELETLFGLLYQPVLTPQQHAAAYGAIGLLAEGNDDFRLEPDLVDVTGRHGVGIVWGNAVFRTTYILDPSSYQVLGYENVTDYSRMSEDDTEHGPGLAGAIVEQGVVDSVDERP